MRRPAVDDFRDDLYSFSVRRRLQLAQREAVNEKASERAYYESLFGAGTLRFIRLMMIPVWIGLAVFAGTIVYAIVEALFF